MSLDKRHTYNIAHKGRQPRELRSCVKVEVAVLDSPPLIVLMLPVDVKQHQKLTDPELRSCVKVEVAFLDSLCA